MKKLKSIRLGRFQKTWLASALGVVMSGTVQANPSGLSVVAGSVSVQAVGKVLEVSNSPGALLNWQQFNISADETTRFIQANAASHVVNRVVGGDPSQILGALQSNGHVFLINPQGILFGAGAQVDTAGLVASTLAISDENLLNQRWQFEGDANAGTLVNLGNLSTHSQGSIVLLAPQIENSGLIHADGEVLLAAGHEVTVVDLKHPTIGLQVKADAGQAALNLGKVIGKHVSVFASLLKNTGVVEATGAQLGQGGVVRFRANHGVQLDNTSVVNASGQAGGVVDIQSSEGDVLLAGQVKAEGEAGEGGRVVATGDRVAVLAGAHVSTDGATRGGQVLLGGGWQGADASVPNARQTIVQENVHVSANALAAGDGGEVVVWADELASVSSVIEAKGASQGGDGGRVETSAKIKLLDVVAPDTSAPQGENGEWLLDPANIVVMSAASIAALDEQADGISVEETVFLSDYAQDFDDNTFISTEGVLDSLTFNSVVRLNTLNQIEGNGVNQPGDITIADPLLLSSFQGETLGAELRLEAAGSVFVNAPVGYANLAQAQENDRFEVGAGSQFLLSVYSEGDVVFNAPLGVNASALNSSFGLNLTFDIDRAVEFNNELDVGFEGSGADLVLSPFDDNSIGSGLRPRSGVVFNANFFSAQPFLEIDLQEQAFVDFPQADTLLPAAGRGLDVSVVGSTLSVRSLQEVGAAPNGPDTPFGSTGLPVRVRVEENLEGGGGFLEVHQLDVAEVSVEGSSTLSVVGLGGPNGLQSGSARVTQFQGGSGGITEVLNSNLIVDEAVFDTDHFLAIGNAIDSTPVEGFAAFGQVTANGIIDVQGFNSQFTAEVMNLGGTLSVGGDDLSRAQASIRRLAMSPTGVLTIQNGATANLGVSTGPFFNIPAGDQGASSTGGAFTTAAAPSNPAQRSTIELIGPDQLVLEFGQLVLEPGQDGSPNSFEQGLTTLDISGLDGTLAGPLNVDVRGVNNQISGGLLSPIQAITIGPEVVVNVQGTPFTFFDTPSLRVLGLRVGSQSSELFLDDSFALFADLNFDGQLSATNSAQVQLGGSTVRLADAQGVSLTNSSLGLFGSIRSADLAAVNRLNSTLLVSGRWDNQAVTAEALAADPSLNPLQNGSITILDDTEIVGGVLGATPAEHGVELLGDTAVFLEGVQAESDFAMNTESYLLVSTDSGFNGSTIDMRGDAAVVFQTDSTGYREVNDRVTFQTDTQGNSVLAGFRTVELNGADAPSSMRIDFGSGVRFQVNGNQRAATVPEGVNVLHPGGVPDRAPFAVGVLTPELAAGSEYDDETQSTLILSSPPDNIPVLLGGLEDEAGNIDCGPPDFCFAFDPLQSIQYRAQTVSALGNEGLIEAGVQAGQLLNTDFTLAHRFLNGTGDVVFRFAGGPLQFTGTEFDGADEVILDTRLRFSAGIQADALPVRMQMNEDLINEGELFVSGVVDFGSNARFVQQAGQTTLAPGAVVNGNLELLGGGLNFAGTVNGNVLVDGAQFRPGNSPGLAQIQGDLNLSSTSQTIIEVQGNGGQAGVDFDRILVSGTANLGGALRISDISSIGAPGRNPSVNPAGEPIAVGQTFTFLQATSVSGNFDSIERTSTGPDMGYTFTDPLVQVSGAQSVVSFEAVSNINDPVIDSQQQPSTPDPVVQTQVDEELQRAFTTDLSDPAVPEEPLVTVSATLPAAAQPEGDSSLSDEEEQEVLQVLGMDIKSKPVSMQSEQLQLKSVRSNPVRPSEVGDCP